MADMIRRWVYHPYVAQVANGMTIGVALCSPSVSTAVAACAATMLAVLVMREVR